MTSVQVLAILRAAYLIAFHRWVIPLVLAALGAGYVIWETVFSDGYALFFPQAIVGFVLLGMAGPALTWALRAALLLEQAEDLSARQSQQLSASNQELEQRIAERTRELSAAKEELAEHADALHQVTVEERRVEEKTRARIAHDLHDGVQQLIVGALFESPAARDTLTRDSATAATRLVTAQQLLHPIETEMRGAIFSLRPVVLDAHGLVPALREAAASFERVAQIACEVTVEGTPRRFDPEAEVVVFRIVQEALNNVQAHARAQRVQIRVEWNAQRIGVQVADDGGGFDLVAVTERANTQLGLIGMRECAASIGGALAIQSRVGEGTRVLLELPLA